MYPEIFIPTHPQFLSNAVHKQKSKRTERLRYLCLTSLRINTAEITTAVDLRPECRTRILLLLCVHSAEMQTQTVTMLPTSQSLPTTHDHTIQPV